MGDGQYVVGGGVLKWDKGILGYGRKQVSRPQDCTGSGFIGVLMWVVCGGWRLSYRLCLELE